MNTKSNSALGLKVK